MKISENTSVSMPMKNMVGIVIAVAMGVFAYTEVTSRLTSLETSRELFQADLLKKSEQKPTDQEQFMLIEDIYKTVEKLEKVIYSKEKEYKVVRNKLNWFKLKPTAFILLIGLFGLAFFYLSTYLETLNIIIQDILSLV